MKTLLEKIEMFTEEKESDYQKFFKKKLKEFGVKEPDELSKEDKKKFYSEIEKEWDKEDDHVDEEEDEDKDKKKKDSDDDEDDEDDDDDKDLDEAVCPKQKADMAKVNAGAMSKKEYDEKWKKKKKMGLGGPGGVYKNMVKEV